MEYSICLKRSKPAAPVYIDPLTRRTRNKQGLINRPDHAIVTQTRGDDDRDVRRVVSAVIMTTSIDVQRGPRTGRTCPRGCCRTCTLVESGPSRRSGWRGTPQLPVQGKKCMVQRANTV